MVITRTPFRISFFGGGTDYPAWYREHGGAVLSTTINKYCYLSVRRLPPFFEHRIRLAYSQVEQCRELDEIHHPAFREILRFKNVSANVEAHYDADLPARSGMGSSSAFAVGLLHALHALQGRLVSKMKLAEEAIHVERHILGEAVGNQDQVAAAHGGLNYIRFNRDDSIVVEPIALDAGLIREFEQQLMLWFTGTVRIASQIARTYSETLTEKAAALHAMGNMANQGISLLERAAFSEFGDLLHEAWVLKQGLSKEVTSDRIKEIYDSARTAGALGGKILGAGGGGFMLLVVPPSKQGAVRQALRGLLEVPFAFERQGSHIIYYDPAWPVELSHD
jgi:D-glycero-alpha-D-manno-heptose-7-phosphate kinase